MKQLGQHLLRGVTRDGLVFVDSRVAHLADQVHLRLYAAVDDLHERRLVQACREVGAVCRIQPFDLVDPLDGEFGGPSRIEASGARVEVRVAFGLLRLGV